MTCGKCKCVAANKLMKMRWASRKSSAIERACKLRRVQADSTSKARNGVLLIPCLPNETKPSFGKMLNHISLQTRLSKYGPRPTLLSTHDCGGVVHSVGCAFGAMRKSKLGRTPHNEAM